MKVESLEAAASGLWRLAIPSKTLPPFNHTNSYLLEDSGVGVLVDPGGEREATLVALATALAKTGVSFLKAILLTHSHADHCSSLAAVQEHYNAVPVYVHPLEMSRLEPAGPVKALNGDRNLTVGQKLVQSLHTPGHSPGHLSFYLPETKSLLVGDIVAGTGSSWIGVPEGDVGAYLDSIERLLALELKVIGPGHGEIIRQPRKKLHEAKAHRLNREEQILKVLKGPALTLTELQQKIYTNLPSESAERLAERTILAHLLKLMRELKVLHLGQDEQGPYALRR